MLKRCPVRPSAVRGSSPGTWSSQTNWGSEPTARPHGPRLSHEGKVILVVTWEVSVPDLPEVGRTWQVNSPGVLGPMAGGEQAAALISGLGQAGVMSSSRSGDRANAVSCVPGKASPSLAAVTLHLFVTLHSRKRLMLACRPSSRRALPISLPSKINCWPPSTSNPRPSRPGMPPS